MEKRCLLVKGDFLGGDIEPGTFHLECPESDDETRDDIDDNQLLPDRDNDENDRRIFGPLPGGFF